jgi:hypothetical protein
MPFSNPILGGDFLIRPQAESPNFVSGVSGWIIRKDGTVEFNNGVFRGSLQTGTAPGQRIILNNPLTGDAIDIYDASNNLIFYVNAFGIASSNNPTTGVSSQLQSGQLELIKGNTNSNAILLPAATTAQQGVLEIDMSPPVGTTYLLRLVGGSDDGSKNPTLTGNERNVQGSIVQSDQVSTNNLIHSAAYSVTTNAGGHAIFNHGCQFTPKTAYVTGTTSGGTFANLTHGVNSLTSTQADINWIIANTNAPWASSLITFDALFIG